MSFDLNAARPPLVTEADRAWAIARRPEWLPDDPGIEHDGELVDDGGWFDDDGPRKPVSSEMSWRTFVLIQAEKFERFFADQRKPHEDWSKLWRFGWWPKIKPEIYFPMAKSKEKHPFYRKGTQEFAIALRLATETEKAMWIKFGVAQFKPDDRRVKTIESAKSKRMAGDVA